MKEGVDAHEWNEFVAARRGSFLQSWEWGVLQEKLGRRIRRIMRETWATLIVEHSFPFKKSYWYAPYGPVIRDEDARSLEVWGSVLRDVACSVDPRPAFIRVEPTTSSFLTAEHGTQIGLRPAAPVQPKETRVIDLLLPEEMILRGMEYQTRYRIRAALRRGVRILRYAGAEASGARFEDFWKLFEETARRHRLRSHPREYYRNILEMGTGSSFRSELFLADLSGTVITAAIIVYFGHMATYLYSASSYAYRTMNGPIRLIWEAMRAAKQDGYTNFDLWGVSHENLKWAGITAFKKTFGGYEVAYGGAWDYVVERWSYTLYTLFKRLRP